MARPKRKVAFNFDDDADEVTDATIAPVKPIDHAPKRLPAYTPSKESPLERRRVELRALAQHSSNSVEHYTPKPIVEAARALMGSIDTDPASSWLANQSVQALVYYGHTRWDEGRPNVSDGLAVPWHGNVFLNPPGGDTSKHAPHLAGISKSYSAIWWGKLVSEWQSKRVQQAVFVGFTLELLQSIQSLPGVMHPLEFPICVPSKRIQFDYPEDTLDGYAMMHSGIANGTQPTHSNFIAWLTPHDTRGPRAQSFADQFAGAFSWLGVCR